MEEDKHNDKDDTFKKPKLSFEEGLNISYDKEELEKYFPSLLSEFKDKKQTISIDSVSSEKEHEPESEKVQLSKNYKENLRNPGAIDFIRRCRNQQEALEVIDYLYMRNELTQEIYELLRTQITQKDGLKELIDICGGFKESGYYVRKYYNNEDITE